VWHILEGHAELLLANAQHVRNIPGRKSDMRDATWLAELLAHDLIRGSFVPPEPIRELRDLTRTRIQLVGEKRQHLQRINKQLYTANIQITGVITDMLGVTGRAVLDALVAGETDPERLDALCWRLLKSKRADRVEALRGHVTPHHRNLIKLHLELIDKIDEQIVAIERLIEESLRPFRYAIELLKTMPGVQSVTAAVVLAEVGPDMHRFPTAGHLVSWAGLCPGQDESAGKKRSTRLRKGAPWLKSVMVQAAWGAVRTRGSYYRALYHRIKARRGPKKAIVAVAASMLRTIYVMLRDKVPYQDIGVEHLKKPQDKEKAIRRHVRRLEELGVEVEIKQAA
jgi:transposase